MKKFKETNFVQILRVEDVEVDVLAKGNLSEWTHGRVWWSSIYPKYRPPGSTTGIEWRKLDDPNNIVFERQKPSGREGWGQETQSPVSQICPSKWCTIQERFFTTLSQVFVTRRGKLCVEGSPWSSLWEPLRSQITYPQGRPCRILLANHLSRRKDLCQSLWSMSAVQ